MLLRRFYDTMLAQASYLVGCQRTGEALVIDPNRDVAQYVRAAHAEGLRIAHVTETHIHADYVSGSRELAAETGARLYLSREGGPDWTYGFAREAAAVLLGDGDSFRVGNVRVDVLHTPGHTPEHLTFLVTDGATTDRPMGAFTGDFIFVGDVGRPDLLERAAGMAGTMEAGARTLFRSIQRFKQLPDWIQIWPAHGAGSACGKALGAVPSSTLGYERFANWGFATESEEDFVRMVLEGQPEPPAYFARMKQVNRDGPALLGGAPLPPLLPASGLAAALASGAAVVDTRGTAAFARRHVPGTLNVPLSASFLSYGGQIIPVATPLYLIVDQGREGAVAEAVGALRLIGFDRIEGVFGLDAVEGAAGTTAQLPPHEVATRLERGEIVLVDVRGIAEYESERIPGARHVALATLARALGDLPRGPDLVLHCETGSRSAVGASLLRARGFERVSNLKGGISAWKAAGLPVTPGRPVTAT